MDRLALLALVLPGIAWAQPEVVADGLDNPRGLAFAPNGALYVAEAGIGAAPGTAEPLCFQGPEGEACFGYTGAITRVWKGEQQRVVDGLASHAAPDGSGATGPHDVSFQGRGGLYAVIGLGADPALREAEGLEGSGLGWLIRVRESQGDWRPVLDVAGYEAEHNPDGGEVDSNPYGLLALPGRVLVVDAGGNDLLKVRANGRADTVAVFPPRLVPAPWGGDIPAEPVPTAVALGPDGAWYVSQLTGFPFAAGSSRIFRVDPASGSWDVYADGLTHVVDLVFAGNGDLYAVEIASASLLEVFQGLAPFEGSVKRIPAGGGSAEVVLSGLFAPGGVAVGAAGDLYVSVCGICPGAGQVLRFPAD